MMHADDTTSTSHNSPLRTSTSPNETTYREAVNELRKKIKNASAGRVHIYRFNVRPDELEAAHTLLDKEDERKAMRVTYSDEYNFIIRYMPSKVHEVARMDWSNILFVSLARLAPQNPNIRPPGCRFIASTTYQLGARKKQADGAIEPIPSSSGRPSIVLEVGSSESLAQLKIDAGLWLEEMPEIQLAIILSIDPPVPPNLHLPRITIELWRGFLPSRPIRSPTARQREGRRVWGADWTHGATPLYLLFSDIFRGPAPADYGDHDRVHFDTVGWRQSIIDTSY